MARDRKHPARQPQQKPPPAAAAAADLCLFGGAFDPPHRSHERLVRAALEQLPVRRVVVLPSGIHPHKGSTAMTDPRTRLELCRMAFADLDRVEVSDWEVERPGRCYTVETLAHFREYVTGGRRPYWLVGSDNLTILPTWHQHHEVLRQAVLVTFPRLGHPVDERTLAAIDLTPAERDEILAHVLDVAPDAVSASAVRADLAAGGDAAAWLHPAVARRVDELGLYGRAP